MIFFRNAFDILPAYVHETPSIPYSFILRENYRINPTAKKRFGVPSIKDSESFFIQNKTQFTANVLKE